VTAPLVVVKSAKLEQGRGSVLGPDTDRWARWWALELFCGHTVERPVRYRPTRRRQRTRSRSDVLPAQKRVRCERCGAAPKGGAA
jgi:hypothetical protein